MAWIGRRTETPFADHEWEERVEALAFEDAAFALSVDISYLSSTSWRDAYFAMDPLQRAAFLRRIEEHKEEERRAFERERAKLKY